MKKLIFLLFFIPIAITLNSCGSVPMFNDYGYIKGWAYREMPPSQIVKNGDSFFEGKLSNGKTYSVFADETIDSDTKYYYNALYQDLGWYSKDEDTWSAPAGSHRPMRGRLYINLKRGVAVYLYPETTFASFKVKVNPKEDN